MNKLHDSEFMIFHQIVHITRYMMDMTMKSLDLRPGQVGILFLLRDSGAMSQKQLADKIGVTAPSMTATIQKLEKKELIVRMKDEEDRRVTRIALSEKGEEHLKILMDHIDQLQEEMYVDFSDEERILFRRLLKSVRENLLNDDDFRGKGMKEIMELTRPQDCPPREDMM